MHDTLTTWARDWGVSPAALENLRARIIAGTPTDPIAVTTQPGTEAAVQQDMRLEASRRGIRLWRNNVGMAHTSSGAVVRFGLANDSAAMNREIKSADLIGIKPIVIRPEHTGVTIGQFVAREVKRPRWRFRGTAREIAQKRFLDLVTVFGGDAAFCTQWNISY